MYLVGAAHPHKADARRLLEAALSDGEKLVTDAEVLQELLHRYVAVDRRDAIQPAFDALLGIVDEVFPVTATDVTRAKAIILGQRQLSARDAIHAAVMEAAEIARIMSFDRGFDSIPGLVRLQA